MLNWIKDHKKQSGFIIGTVLIILLIMIGYYTWTEVKGLNESYYDKKHNINTVTLEDQKKLRGSEKLKFENERKELIEQRGKAIANENVIAPKVVKEVQHVARGGRSEHINDTVTSAIQEKSDETKIIEEEKSVDVYKINHEKKFKLKAGATYIDGEGYINYGIQYKKAELILHTKDMNPSHIEGGTIMFTVYER